VTASGPPIRLLPRTDGASGFFWTSGADGRLRFLHCDDCGRLVHPPAPRCPDCLSPDVAPRPVSGRATVHAFTVNHQQWIPGADPYVVALVAVDEQPDVRLVTNLVGVDGGDVRVGLRVEVVFEQHEDVFLPLFRPVGQGGDDLDAPASDAPSAGGEPPAP
jgi:uncharacterized OB-fold protein